MTPLQIIIEDTLIYMRTFPEFSHTDVTEHIRSTIASGYNLKVTAEEIYEICEYVISRFRRIQTALMERSVNGKVRCETIEWILQECFTGSCNNKLSVDSSNTRESLDKVREACRSRGDLPGGCRGCPANPDGDEVPCDRNQEVFARCRLGFPRTWDTEKMEQEIQAIKEDRNDRSIEALEVAVDYLTN